MHCSFVEESRTMTPVFGTERILNVDITLYNIAFENEAVYVAWGISPRNSSKVVVTVECYF